MVNSTSMPDDLSPLSLSLGWVRGQASSHQGYKRQHNEDQFFLEAWPDQPACLAIVADGMGGNRGGKEAAQVAIATLKKLLDKPLPESPRDRYDFLMQGIYEADAEVRDQGSQSFQLLGMGATIAAAIVTPEDYLYLHAGDCRFYHIRDGAIVRQSQDHSIVRILVELEKIRPEEVRNHPMRSVVNSCLGGRGGTGNFAIDPKWQDEDPPIYRHQPGDWLLLCSDGLHSMISNELLLDVMQADPQDPDAIVQSLIQKALDEGGEDNITISLMQLQNPSEISM